MGVPGNPWLIQKYFVIQSKYNYLAFQRKRAEIL